MLLLNLFLLTPHAVIIGKFAMSILQKIFKRRKTSGNSVSELNVSNTSQSEQQGLLGSPVDTKSSESDLSDRASPESCGKVQLKQLKTSLRKLQKQNGRLRRRQMEVVALDAEVTQVLSLIALTKRQVAALDEEIINKRCELQYLKSEFSSEDSARVKTREPTYHKRCTLLKTSADAGKLLTEVRERVRDFRLLELMIYTRALELKYNLVDGLGTKRSILLKNKLRHFDHLSDAIRERQNALSPKEAGHKTSSDSKATSGIQCFRISAPETSHTNTTPSGIIPLTFPVSSPMTQQGVGANDVIPLAPPVPHMQTTTL